LGDGLLERVGKRVSGAEGARFLEARLRTDRPQGGLSIAALDVKEIDDQVLQQLLNDDPLRGRAKDVILRAVYDQLVRRDAQWE